MYVGAAEEMLRWCVLQRVHSGDECELTSTLCKYDFRNGDLFILSIARVRRVRRGSVSPELLICGGDVRSILLLPLVDRRLETKIYVYCFYVRCNDCLGVCGNVCCVTGVVQDVVLALEW